MKELLVNIKRKPNERKKVGKQINSGLKEIKIIKGQQKNSKINSSLSAAVDNSFESKQNFLDKRSISDLELDMDFIIQNLNLGDQ